MIRPEREHRNAIPRAHHHPLLSRLLNRARTIIGRFTRRATDHLWVHRAALADYRSLNRRLRVEQNIPRRFDEPVSPDSVLPEFNWREMRDKIRSAAHAATDAGEAANITLADHLLTTMNKIDREALDPAAVRSLPTPPVSQPMTETV